MKKKVSIFFKNKPVWRIFSPGFMFSEMNLWKFRHYFWQFRHYFWKLDFSSTLMLKLMETLFFKLLCRTPELPLALPLVTRHAIYLASIAPLHCISFCGLSSGSNGLWMSYCHFSASTHFPTQSFSDDEGKEGRTGTRRDTHILYTCNPSTSGRQV